MKKGNKRFFTGKREDHNFLAQQRASAKGQCSEFGNPSCRDDKHWVPIADVVAPNDENVGPPTGLCRGRCRLDVGACN
jgi:hypothetical protein